jgi:hypothetical protein
MTSKRARLYVITTVASFMVMYHILAGVWGSPNSVGMRFVHLSGAMIIVMMSKPFSKKHTKLGMCVDVLLGFSHWLSWFISCRTLTALRSAAVPENARRGAWYDLPACFAGAGKKSCRLGHGCYCGRFLCAEFVCQLSARLFASQEHYLSADD